MPQNPPLLQHHPKAARANTLPSYEAAMRSAGNNNNSVNFVDVPLHNSVTSLPTSEDNEVFNFDNR